MKNSTAYESAQTRLLLENLVTMLVVAFIFSMFAFSVGCSSHRGSDGLPGAPGASVVGPQGERGENGVNGRDGIDGTNATVAVIDPCGKQSTSGLDEVLLHLGHSRYITYFESGNNRHLALVGPGTYRTTDGTLCTFTVQPDGGVTWAN